MRLLQLKYKGTILEDLKTKMWSFFNLHSFSVKTSVFELYSHISVYAVMAMKIKLGITLRRKA